jgi:methionyl-tRNA synthetase
MTHKYFEGRVPNPDSEADRDLRLGLQAGAFKAVSEYETAMDSFAFHKALMSVWEFINQMNKCIDVTAPWELAKRKETRRQLETVIYNLLEGLRVISGLVYPVMPETAQRMQRHLGFDAQEPFPLENLKKWNSLPTGIELPKSTTLFPRIDEKQAAPPKETPQKSGGEVNKKEGKPEITLDDLDKIDLRIGTVTAAEPVPKAKKLLKLQVDIGEDRTVVAGIAGSYQPDALLGKQVVVVANLKPAKLMGVLSQGMLLAAAGGDGLVLVGPDGEVDAGTPLS